MDTIWGPPPDDTTTIRELERLRWSGATFIVFVWSAFWWDGDKYRRALEMSLDYPDKPHFRD